MISPEISAIFVRNVNRILEEKNLSKAELAVRLGINKSSGVSQLLAKDTNPTLERIAAVAKALEVPIIELLREEGPYLRPHTLEDCMQTVKKALEKLEKDDV